MAEKGKWTLDTLRNAVASGEVTQVLTAFPDYYGRLVGKRIMGGYFIEHVVDDGIHACDYLLTVDMEMDPVPGYRFSSWETGYGDFHVVPDWQTLRVASWLEGTALVLCDLHDEEDGSPIDVAPRTILRRQIDRAAASGYRINAGSELEFYLFNDA